MRKFNAIAALWVIAAEMALAVFFMAHPQPLPAPKPTVLQSVDVNQLARELLTSKAFSCLEEVIYVESRGNPDAKNPESTARGIGQLLASTYRNIGMRHSTDPKAQLIAMLAYISERYGSGGPCSALAHERRYNFF